MAKTKVFHDSSVMLPYEWMGAVGAPKHRFQGGLTVVATTKTAAMTALVERGEHERWARETVRGLRVMPPDPYFQPFSLLVEAGIVDPAIPGVYVWNRGSGGDPIIRVEPDGTFTTIARLEVRGLFGSQTVAIPEPNTEEA